MVVWIEGVLAVLAYASTIIATLRAGSRGLYLVEHDHIGVMDGPLILGPSDRNESVTSQLWELSFAFQESVRLSVSPHLMDHELVVDDNSINQPSSLDLYHMQSNETHFQTNETKNDEGFVEQKTISLDEKKHRFLNWSLVPIFVSRAKLQFKSIDVASLRNYMFLWQKAFWKGLGRIEEDNIINLDFFDGEWDYGHRLVADTIVNGKPSSESGHSAKIMAYAPKTFQDLRSRFGVSENDFTRSILSSGPFVSFQSNSKGAARAGGVFFFSRDGSYMIKTIKKAEVAAFLEMLPKYHKYMRKNGRKSLLTRFFGMYSVTLEAETPKSTGILASAKERFMPSKSDENVFVIMNSVFPAEGSKFISERYDLKGSTVGRECSDEEKLRRGSNAILKDLDLAREVELVRSLERPQLQASYGFNIGATAKASLLSQLRRDVTLLVECNVMDYSLLVGVVNMNSGHLDVASMEAFEKSELYESILRRHTSKRKSIGRAMISSLATPLRILGAPATFFGRRLWEKTEATISSILTLPLPYYGAGICGIDGGTLSLLKGQRNGKRAIFYVGVIDFLQPWTSRKVLERQLKGIMGYDTQAISCVPPDEYAARFLDFIACHVS